MKICAFDPGVCNHAYSVISLKSLDILSIGHLDNPISSLKEKDLENNVKLYLWEIENLLNKIEYEPLCDKLVIERYQSRGNYRNNQIELVNVMIGVLVGHYPNAFLVMPATWKTFIKRHYQTNNMLELLEASQLSPHIADATGMAAYYAERYCQQSNILERLKNSVFFQPEET